MTKRILLADEHQLVTAGIKKILENADSTIKVVGCIHLAQELIEAITYLEPDLLIMEFQWTNQKGCDFIESIVKAYAKLPIIILTNVPPFNCCYTPFYKLGVRALLSKDINLELFLKTIDWVEQGYRFLPPQTSENVNLSLTEIECEILRLVADDKTNFEISRILFTSKRTIDHHVSSILKKLNVHSRVGAVMKAIQFGMLSTF